MTTPPFLVSAPSSTQSPSASTLQTPSQQPQYVIILSLPPISPPTYQQAINPANERRFYYNPYCPTGLVLIPSAQQSPQLYAGIQIVRNA